MMKPRSVLSVIVAAVVLWLWVPHGGFAVEDLMGKTPPGLSWQTMDAEIQGLKDRLARESQPVTSAQVNKHILMMNRIIALYGEGRRLFAEARPVTGDESRERQWYGHMMRMCRMYGDAWRRKATEMEATLARLRGEGK